MEEQNIQIYIEPSNIDYVIIKIKEETIEERGSVYEATRRAWHAKLSTAEPYKYVLSVVSGIVREVYEVEKWMQGSEERVEFVGHIAPQNIVDYFKGKMIPEKYRVKGLASPFLYKKLQDGEATMPIDLPEPVAETQEIHTPSPIVAEPPKRKNLIWLWIALAVIIVAAVLCFVLL